MSVQQNEFIGPAFVLGSLLAAYPESEFAQNINLLLDDSSLDGVMESSISKIFEEVRTKTKEIISDENLVNNLRSEYIDRFDRGKEVTSLYETEYGRSRAMVKGTELVDIAGFYRAFGLETGGDGVQAEMIDHVAVELEFYALMILKANVLADAGDAEGVSIVLDARKKFLKSHLGRFVGAICERPGVMDSSYYYSVFKFCRDLVLDECARLEVIVEPESWIASQSEVGDISCGGSVGCLK